MPQARHLKSPFPCVHRKEMTFRATLLSVVILNCIGMWIGSEKKERCRLGMLMPECGNAELASHMQERSSRRAMMIGEAGRVYIYIYIYIRRPTTNDTPKNSETAVGAINLLLRLINRRLHSFSPIGIFLPIGNICYHG